MGPDCLRKQKALRCVSSAAAGTPADEVNAAVIATAIGAAAVHEALTFWDIAYAEPLRRPEPNEQHVHSFLEVLPIMALLIWPLIE